MTRYRPPRVLVAAGSVANHQTGVGARISYTNNQTRGCVNDAAPPQVVVRQAAEAHWHPRVAVVKPELTSALLIPTNTDVVVSVDRRLYLLM